MGKRIAFGFEIEFTNSGGIQEGKLSFYVSQEKNK
jgi:hypothetical protein